MNENVTFNGHFKIQAIDLNNKIVDEWEDDNMIMSSARVTMSEIFANLGSTTFINSFKIGTLGHIGDLIVNPKGTDNGFTKERDRLFSEVSNVNFELNDMVSLIRKNDVIYIVNTQSEQTGYYKYIGTTATDYHLTTGALLNNTLWQFLGVNKPYVYSINFTLPGTNNDINGTSALNITEDVENAGSVVKVLQTGTSVVFTIDIANAAGNLQNTPASSIFTEAALYANDKIFAMKTFKAKIKDSTVLLRIIWTITF